MLKNPHSLCLLLPPLLLLPTTNSARSGQRAPWSPLLAGSHSPGTMRAGGISSIREEAKSHLLGPPQPARAAMGLWESRACCPSAGSQSASFFARDSSIQGDLMFDVQFQGAVVKPHRSEPLWTPSWEAELLARVQHPSSSDLHPRAEESHPWGAWARGRKQGCKWGSEIWAAVGLLAHHEACSRGDAGCETGPRSSCFMPKPSTACQHLVPFQPLLLLGAAPCTGALRAPNRGDFSPAPPHSPLRAAPCLWGYREGNRGRSTPRTACFCLPA